MGFRFRKSIKLAPGIRWNVGSGGSSWSFGPRGASVSMGKLGMFLNAGAAGFSWREQLIGSSSPARTASYSSWGASPPAVANSPTTSMSMTCGIRDDGTIYFVDKAGAPMPEHWAELAKEQNEDAIRALIQRSAKT